MAMWEAGDVGVCVSDPFDGDLFLQIIYGPDPEVGKTYRVLQVTKCSHCGEVGLVIRAGGIPFHTDHFRKVQKGSGDLFEKIKKCRPRDDEGQKTPDKILEDA